jgi:hypothetical protein
MLSGQDTPVFPSSLQIASKEKSPQTTFYEKLYPKSFIEGTEKLFIEASINMGEKLIAEEELKSLFQIIGRVPLYENDEKEVSVRALQNEIRTLHSNFQNINNYHPYLPILKKLEETILLITDRKKLYIPHTGDEEKRYPLLKKLEVYEKEHDERILPNYFIEYLLQHFWKASREYHNNFLQIDAVKSIVKSMTEYKTISTFKAELKDIHLRINQIAKDHPYISILNNLPSTVNDFLSFNNNLSLEIVGDRKAHETHLRKARIEWGKDAAGLLVCGLWAIPGLILNGGGTVCEEVPLPRPFPSDPQTTQKWHLFSPRNSIKALYEDIEKQNKIITTHSTAPLRQTMK